MNPDLYTDEYRNFKFLKSPALYVEYFKTARAAANHIQPCNNFDKEFNWPYRLEFVEQLLDLRHDIVYVVGAGVSTKIGYESASIIEIYKPMILTENPIIYETSREVTIDDILFLEDILYPHFCLCEESAFDNCYDISTFNGQGRIIRIETLPIVPHSKTDFTEMFYDKNTAEKYGKALTKFLRGNIDALPVLSARF